MKKKVLIAIVFLTGFLNASSQKVSDQTVKNFCKSWLLNHKYGKDVVRATSFQAWGRMGQNSVSEMEIAIENLYQHPKFREAIYQSILRLGGCNYDMLFQQFNSLKLASNDSKELAFYILDKYCQNKQSASPEKIFESKPNKSMREPPPMVGYPYKLSESEKYSVYCNDSLKRCYNVFIPRGRIEISRYGEKKPFFIGGVDLDGTIVDERKEEGLPNDLGIFFQIDEMDNILYMSYDNTKFFKFIRHIDKERKQGELQIGNFDEDKIYKSRYNPSDKTNRRYKIAGSPTDELSILISSHTAFIKINNWVKELKLVSTTEDGPSFITTYANAAYKLSLEESNLKSTSYKASLVDVFSNKKSSFEIELIKK